MLLGNESKPLHPSVCFGSFKYKIRNSHFERRLRSRHRLPLESSLTAAADDSEPFQNYAIKFKTSDPFSRPKELTHLEPRRLSSLFEPAPRSDTLDHTEFDWWQRLFRDTSISPTNTESTGSALLHYFPAAQTWTSKGSLVFVVGIGHELLAFDNIASSTSQNSEHGTVQFSSGRRHDFWTHRGSSIASEGAPSPRSDFAFATLGRKLLIWGGRSSSGKPEALTDGAIYDLQTNHWTQLSSDNAPESCDEATAVVLGEVAVVQGSGPCQHKGTKNVCRYSDGSWASAPSAWSIYDSRTNHFTRADDSGAPSISELCLHPFKPVGSRLVGLGNVGWIFDATNNAWSSFSLPQLRQSDRLGLDREVVLSDDQLLVPGVNYEQPTAYVVYPAQQHICRLPLERFSLFTRRSGYYSRVGEVAVLNGKPLLRGRHDQQPDYCLSECKGRLPPQDDTMNQGFIVTLPKKP